MNAVHDKRDSPDAPRMNEVRFRLLSSDFSIRTDSPAAAGLFRRVFGRPVSDVGMPDVRYELTQDPDEPRFSLRSGDEQLVRRVTASEAFGYAVWHVMQTAVAASRHVIVHAGAVSLGGNGILFPGASGSGKTTLTAGLLRAGFAYLSDEMGAIDPATLRIVPVPRALSLKAGSLPLFGGIAGDVGADERWFLDGSRPIRPEDLGTSATALPVPIRAVIAPRYAPGAETELLPVSRATGLSDLAANAFNLDTWGGRGLRILGDAVGSARCYRLTFGDLHEAVARIRESLGDD